MSRGRGSDSWVAWLTSGGNTTTVLDVYALGRLAYQTDGSGNKLATFTYDTNGMPSSVVVGSGTTLPRYYYVYNGHGDVVALTDATGTVVASYSYDAFGNLTSSSESLPNGWSNPYRYDGRERVRYDSETGLYWMSVRAYDPTLGRFISHDPLGRMAALGLDRQPYVYVDNNPVVRTDPEGMIGPCGGRPMFDGEVCVPVSNPPPPPPVTSPPPENPCMIAGKHCNSGGNGKGSGSGTSGQTAPTTPNQGDPGKAKDAMNDASIYFAVEQSRINSMAHVLNLVGLLVTGLGAILSVLGVTILVGVPLAAIGLNIGNCLGQSCLLW